jgi:hypothetical protein
MKIKIKKPEKKVIFNFRLDPKIKKKFSDKCKKERLNQSFLLQQFVESFLKGDIDHE